MASTTMGDVLPTGGRVFTSIPDLFFIPEFVFGGLVWMLVASAGFEPVVVNVMGWVMFVSVFCFVMTTLWFFIFLCGANRSSSWPALDVGYHFVATVFYLSASVPLAFITVLEGQGLAALAPVPGVDPFFLREARKIYKLHIAAVVMSYLATLFYFIHTIFSAIRWKRS
ncbi:myelin and lymphocyte protein-like isoform X1 [Trematomus bernacchii]|uniref:myelin and lymphocyte protein-like isoform X1 n=1 Tax=Trematomus bernacchii TaxID=40690 RepID=UPI00146B1499|nr:myelin and lymphocyte protein-like isoform X1 [Trematomus bernacchii]